MSINAFMRLLRRFALRNDCLKLNQKGFAIFTVIFVMVAFTFLGMSAVELVNTGTFQMEDEYHTQQAFSVATAGLAYVAEQLSNDTDWSDESDFTKTFGPGSFSVAYTDKQRRSITITIDGTVQGITRQIRQGLKRPPKSFTVASYSERNIIAVGLASIAIDGDSSAGGTHWGNVSVTGDQEDNNADAEIPTVDWSYWQGVADYYITGNYTFTSGTYTGIYYITGNVTIGGSSVVTLNGTLITERRLSVTGTSNLTVNATAPNPAIIAGNQVSFGSRSQSDIDGWVYSVGNIIASYRSVVDVVGGMASGGNIVAIGQANVSIDYDGSYAPSDGFTGGEPGKGSGPGGMDWEDWDETFD